MILLVRHGETFWNRERRIQGQSESELTPLGERQAAAIGGLIADLVRRDAARGWRLVSSPIGRARQTADAVSRATGLALEVDARLAEIGCGEWEGLLHAEVARRHPEHYARQWVYGAPGGETFEDVLARAESWHADQPPEPDRRLIAVSHGVWGRCLRGAYARLDRDATDGLATPQDAVYRLANGQIDRFDCEPVD